MYFVGGSKDLQHYKDYLFAWKSIAEQKMVLVCYKEGSDEIIGANFTYVTHKDDHFVEHFSAGVSNRTSFEMFIKIYISIISNSTEQK